MLLQRQSAYMIARMSLCQKLGETPELFTSLVGLSRYYGLTGDIGMGDKLSKQLLVIAQASGEPDLLLEAYRLMGGHLFSWGRLEEARESWENGLSLYHVALHERHANRFGHDPSATCLGFLSMTLWLLGFPEQALGKSQDLFNLIPSFTHPASQAYAYCLLAMQACLRSATKDTLDYAATAIEIAQLHGLSSWSYLATALKGQALIEQEEVDEGAALLQEGIQAWQARGFAHFTPFLLSLQAAACMKLRKLNDGMDAVLAAQAIVKNGCDRYWEAELYRLHGELHSALGMDDQNVERYFRLGLETARLQGARMLELRAPDLHVTIHQQLAEGDQVMTYKTLHGTHLGEFMGIPPTGKQVSFDLIDIFDIANGKIIAHRAVVNMLGLLQQLGVVPAPG
jgi:predicted ester cyclase